eukprot:2395017-Prymnesium_polylepis.1
MGQSATGIGGNGVATATGSVTGTGVATTTRSSLRPRSHPPLLPLRLLCRPLSCRFPGLIALTARADSA